MVEKHHFCTMYAWLTKYMRVFLHINSCRIQGFDIEHIDGNNRSPLHDIVRYGNSKHQRLIGQPEGDLIRLQRH